MSVLSANQQRQQRGIFTMGALVLIFTYLFYLNSDKKDQVTFGFVLDKEWKLITEWKVDSKTGVILFLLLAAIGVAVSYLLFRQNKALTLGSFIFGFGIMTALS